MLYNKLREINGAHLRSHGVCHLSISQGRWVRFLIVTLLDRISISVRGRVRRHQDWHQFTL